MSYRTLIEINHDTAELSDEFMQCLGYYLKSGSREDADYLKRFGVTVIGMRHHSGNFILDGEPEGFPVNYLPRQKAAAQSPDGEG